MRVDDDALDVRDVRVVLQRAHVEARLLAKLRDPRAVVVRHVVRHPIPTHPIPKANLGSLHAPQFELCAPLRRTRQLDAWIARRARAI